MVKWNINKLPAVLATAVIFLFCRDALQAQDFDSTPPLVVKCSPEAGSDEVAPGVIEIRVTFSKPMTDRSWSWSSAWKNSVPKPEGKPRNATDRKTCILKVRLEPNTTYGYWLNSEKFHGFKDERGQSAVPYLLVFKTKHR
jgi:hypothetical protein